MISNNTNALYIGLPIESAHFMIDYAEYLSKLKIGEFIGGLDDFNQCACAHTLSRWYFKKLRIDEALRRLVKNVKLPNESQQIDRILEKFGGAYHDQNFGIFRDADTAYVLAFSILMLNTDLHNSAIPFKNKMSLQQFIDSNSGVDGGSDLPTELVTKIYGRIASHEIIVNYDDEIIGASKSQSNTALSSAITDSFPTVDTSGWLGLNVSSGVFFSAYMKQWCCYYNGYFYHTDQFYCNKGGKPISKVWFKMSMEKAVVTPDKDGVSITVSGPKSADNELTVIKNVPNTKQPTILKRKKFSLRAASREERDAWVSWLHGLHDLYTAAEASEGLDPVTEAAKFAMINVLHEVKGSKSTMEELQAAAKKLDQHLEAKNIKVRRLTMRASSNFSRAASKPVPTLGIEVQTPSAELPTLQNIPDPITEGWVRCKVNEHSWKRRYFVLLPDVDGGGTTLFIFLNTDLAQVMLTTGLQCQQGYVRMRKVVEVELNDIPE
jgi:hypothetical protein